LKNRFLDVVEVEFWIVQEAENGFACLFDPLENGFLDFLQVACRQKRTLQSGYPLKHRFLNLAQV
jgi:hypothetical protein